MSRHLVLSFDSKEILLPVWKVSPRPAQDVLEICKQKIRIKQADRCSQQSHQHPTDQPRTLPFILCTRCKEEVRVIRHGSKVQWLQASNRRKHRRAPTNLQRMRQLRSKTLQAFVLLLYFSRTSRTEALVLPSTVGISASRRTAGTQNGREERYDPSTADTSCVLFDDRRHIRSVDTSINAPFHFIDLAIFDRRRYSTFLSKTKTTCSSPLSINPPVGRSLRRFWKLPPHPPAAGACRPPPRYGSTRTPR